jgi:hypothetical protein
VLQDVSWGKSKKKREDLKKEKPAPMGRFPKTLRGYLHTKKKRASFDALTKFMRL